MKLAKELIGLMSDYYALNKLGLKLANPANQEYMELLKPDIAIQFLEPYGFLIWTAVFSEEIIVIDPVALETASKSIKNIISLYTTNVISSTETRKLLFDEEIKLISIDLLTKVDLVTKGAVFLYFNEILAWNEVKVLLNIGTTGVILYKIETYEPLGAYDIILTLLSVLFGKVNYTTVTPVEYPFKRLTNDIYYWNQPVYYYGYKIALSYTNIDGILDNIDWFISENPEIDTMDVVPDRIDVLGMLRINNKFCETVITDNALEPTTETEKDNLGLYNIALNVIRLNDTPTFGLGNVLFDFYKSIKETTVYSDDYLTYQTVDWTTIRNYCKYIDIILELDTNVLDIEKTGNIIRNIQNFLIH